MSFLMLQVKTLSFRSIKTKNKIGTADTRVINYTIFAL